MSPKDSAQFLDKITIKILLLLSSFVVGTAASALLIYAVPGWAGQFKLAQVPDLLVILLPLSVYSLLSVGLTLATVFLLPKFLLVFAARFLKVNERRLAKLTVRVDKLKNHPLTRSGGWVRSSASMEPVKVKITRLIHKSEGEINQLVANMQHWYEVGAHLYFVVVAIRFALLTALVVCAQYYHLHFLVVALGICLIHLSAFFHLVRSLVRLLQVLGIRIVLAACVLMLNALVLVANGLLILQSKKVR